MNNILNSRNFYIALAAIPILIWCGGFAMLSSSPYLGIKFEYKNDICYIKSAKNNPQLNNEEDIKLLSVISG